MRKMALLVMALGSYFNTLSHVISVGIRHNFYISSTACPTVTCKKVITSATCVIEPIVPYLSP